jgi:drug/metabolite transporter (DMT)-like permease
MGYAGIIFALVALVCWGFGDFFIQRTSRKVGIVDALFYIDLIGAVVLTPFVWHRIPELDSFAVGILLLGGIFITVAAFLLFQGLKIGKLSIVEPIASLELPFTVLVAALFGQEHLGWQPYLLIFIVFLGIVLSVTEGLHVFKNSLGRVERGTWFVLAGACFMALSNVTIGLGSQASDPLMAIWATNLVTIVPCLIYYIYTQRFGLMLNHIRKYPGTVLAEVVFDNGAWIAYAAAVLFIPISVAVTITESYIILAVLLGIIINREKLRHHQYLGIILAIGGVLLLAILTS